ncbi:MAG TPA: hypothetical protein VK095_00845 [Beutenbergiaceae bacterium]|nr:hypothetical protein [Beutenbergiaceae bacterium]
MTTPEGSNTPPDGSGQQPWSGQQPSGQPGPAAYGQPETYGGQPGQSAQPGQYGQPTQPGAYEQAGQSAQYGQPAQYGQGGQYGQPGEYTPAGVPRASGAAGPRPGTVTAAAVLAWIGSVLLIFLGLMMLAIRAVDPADAGVPADEAALVQEFASTLGIAALIWGALVLVAAILAFRGMNWARWVLVVLGVLATLGFLFNIVVAEAFLAIIPLVWVVASVALLLAPASRDWYNARRGGQFNPNQYTG